MREDAARGPGCRCCLLRAFFLLLICGWGAVSAKEVRNVAFFFLSEDLSYQSLVNDVMRQLNDRQPGFDLNPLVYKLELNPIMFSQYLCDYVIPKEPVAALIMGPSNKSYTTQAASYVLGYYQISLISLVDRDAIFSDKVVHRTLLRTVVPYYHQAEVWIQLLHKFSWAELVFMHSDDYEGRTALSHFQNLATLRDVTISTIIQLPNEGTDSNFVPYLRHLKQQNTRILIVHFASSDLTQYLFNAANALDLFEYGFVWLMSETGLTGFEGQVPQGVISTKMMQTTKQKQDKLVNAIYLLYNATNDFYLKSGYILTNSYDTCDEDVGSVHFNWQTQSSTFFEGIKQQNIEQITPHCNSKCSSDGTRLYFDELGDPVTANYSLVVYHQVSALSTAPVVFGSYQKTRPSSVNFGSITVNEDNIIWPGCADASLCERPSGRKFSTHLKIVSILEIPFLSAVMLDEGRTCDEIDLAAEGISELVACPRQGFKETFCCHGYLLDLIATMSRTLNFTYDLHQVADGQYGKPKIARENGIKKTLWDGMIGEVLKNEADVIVAPLTITPERMEVIDFSKPYKYQGMTILVKRSQKDSNLASFLQPFQNTLWMLVILAIHLVAFFLWLFDRFSPFGRFKLAKEDEAEDDALNLSTAIWFAWGVLLNSGIGEGTPRSFSARVLGMVWAGFSMIIVASYTANLAAFLVLDRPEASISGINDARLRNPTDTFKFATVKDSSVADYFKNHIELSTIFRTMELTGNYATADDAIQAVKNEELHAFIWDSSRLFYEASQDCELVTAGELFGRSGYGIGVAKHSPWMHSISISVLKMHEKGEMEKLDNQYIYKEKSCVMDQDVPATLGLVNMAGVFMLVAGGILLGTTLIAIEILYKRRRSSKERQNKLARKVIKKWRSHVAKKKYIRELEREFSDTLRKHATIVDSPSTQLRRFSNAARHHHQPT